MIPDRLKPGDGLNIGWLNGLRNAAGASILKVDPRTGLQLLVTPFGAFLRSIAPPDGWFLVTANLGGGSYTIVSQIEATGGTWTTGPRTATAYEANLNASVPSASTQRVWATLRRNTWRFTWGACS